MEAFKVGDTVDVTNDYGVKLGKKTIVRIATNNGKNIYYLSPTDTHWAHWHESNLRHAALKESCS